eukprot:c47216_g1_i1.p1 GENE.c47216_g1_i1~~c47216_g1_i1.p1  ORF type:complete len:449 (-),score=93.92 c47216_g1_i1:39-1277(-)
MAGKGASSGDAADDALYKSRHYRKRWAVSTKAIHAGQAPDEVTGATIPPLYLTSTYTQPEPGKAKGYEYSRTQNPTKERLEQCLAAMEGGEDAAVFASGLAATTAILHTLRPGDGVVAGHDLYGGTFRLMDKIFRPWGLEIVFAADGTVDAYAKALRSLKKPKLVWSETPTNPLLDVSDIAGLVALGHSAGCTVVVDNTFATPALQQPIALGADLVVHSMTKYLGGHSDVVGGCIIAAKKSSIGTHADQGIRFYQNAAGPQAGPFDSWLVQRGVKTLALRMERHCDSAEKVVEAVSSLRGIKAVMYPGLPSHAGHKIAAKQMKRFGGMVTIKVDGMERAKKFTTALEIFSLAESLGGVESLVCHPATMTHGSIPKAMREARGVDDGLIRLSVGIEDVNDLIADIKQAAARSL